MQSKPLIYDLNLSELQDALDSLGEPSYRACQIWQGLYVNLWRSPDEFTNLPLRLRNQLRENFHFSHLEPAAVVRSKDGETVKTLFRLPDDQAIEAVLMRYERR